MRIGERERATGRSRSVPITGVKTNDSERQSEKARVIASAVASPGFGFGFGLSRARVHHHLARRAERTLVALELELHADCADGELALQSIAAEVGQEEQELSRADLGTEPALLQRQPGKSRCSGGRGGGDGGSTGCSGGSGGRGTDSGRSECRLLGSCGRHFGVETERDVRPCEEGTQRDCERDGRVDE